MTKLYSTVVVQYLKSLNLLSRQRASQQKIYRILHERFKLDLV